MTTHIPKISNVKELIKGIYAHSTNGDYAELMKRMNLRLKEVEPLCFWNGEGCSRISIESDDHFDLMLMCWEKGHEASIDEKEGMACWIYVVQGNLLKENYQPNGISGEYNLEGKEIIGAGQFSYQKENNGLKRISNLNNGRTISLHLVAKSNSTED